MIKKYSCYEYELTNADRYSYTIHLEQNYLGQDEVIESDEWYENEEEAQAACISRIDDLENGEGKNEY